MKTILFLTHHFPPFNSIATHRPYSWCIELSKRYKVIVITKDWGLKVDKNENENIITFRVKTKEVEITKTNILLKLFKGQFQVFEELEENYYDKAIEIYKNNKIDLIIATALPVELVKVAYRLNKEYNTPYIADFRDFWFMFLHKKRIPFKQKLMSFAFSKVVKKWVSNAEVITGVSYKIIDYFKHKNKIVIYNGYDNAPLNIEMPKEGYADKFNISCIGQIYPHQNISLIMNVFRQFEVKYNNISINFIGLPKNEHERIKKYNLQSVFISDRIPKEESDKYLYNSNILFYNAWKGWQGIYSGKIFEYLGSLKNIIVAPSDDDVVKKLMQETNAGIISDLPEELFSFLESKYLEWIQVGKISYCGKISAIEFYSRRNQANFLVDNVNMIFSKI